MKRIFLLCLALLLAACSAAAESLSDPIAVSVTDRAALIRADGNEIVAMGTYTVIFELTEDQDDAPLFAAGKINDEAMLYTLLDADGNALTEAEYDMLSYSNGVVLFSQNDLYGAMDRSGHIFLDAAYTALVVNEDGGLLGIKTDCWDDQADGVYYISPDGNETATGVKTLSLFETFSEGRMAMLSAENNRYGYVDSKGSWLVRPQFSYAMQYENGYAVASIASGCGMIDMSGNWAITPRYDYIWHFGSLLIAMQDESLCVVFDGATLKEKYRLSGEGMYVYGETENIVVGDNNSVRLVDPEGNLLFTAPASASIYEAANGSLIVSDGPWGSPAATLYGADGTQICTQYQSINELCMINGVQYFSYMVMDAEPDANDPAGYWSYDIMSARYGLMDENGREITPTQFTDMFVMDDSLIYAATESEIGIIDANGEWIVSWPAN